MKQLIPKLILWAVYVLAGYWLLTWIRDLLNRTNNSGSGNFGETVGGAAGGAVIAAVNGAFNAVGAGIGTEGAKVYGDLFPSEKIVFDPSGTINGAWATPEQTAENQIENANLAASIAVANLGF